MIWKIAKKEFLLNLISFKFVVGMILCVVLTVILMPVLVKDYESRLQEYRKAIAETEAELRKVIVYNNIDRNIDYMVHRPPALLSVFSKGVETQQAGSVQIKMIRVPEITARATEVNPYISVLPSLDISFIFAVVLSVLALLVAGDVISAEREQGTLKLILSGTVARHQVLLGKLLAGLMTLLVPLTMVFLIGLLVLLSSAMVELTLSDWYRIGLIYTASLVFIAAIYNIGLLVSCLARNSAISLIIGLFFWVAFIMVVPQVSVYLAAQIAPLESEEKLDSQVSQVTLERTAYEKFPPLRGQEVRLRDDMYGSYILVCTQASMDSYKKYWAGQNSFWSRKAEKTWEIRHQHVETLFEQKRLADNISRISPVSLYDIIISNLSGTDAYHGKYFIDQVRAHRNELIDYIHAKTDNYSSPLYFTPCTENDTAVYQDYLDKKISEESFQKWKQEKIAQVQPLDLQDLPRFVYKPKIVNNFPTVIKDLGRLIFINVLFFALSFLGFMKYDVR